MNSSKSFWRRPEGVTGGIVLTGLGVAAALLLYNILPVLIVLAQNTLYLAGMLAALAVVMFMVLDPKTRNLIWYAYQALMRWITGLFVRIDPISILKTYIEDLENNLRQLSKQIGALRGQMRQLKGLIETNTRDIQRNMTLAGQARKQQDDKNLALATRKAGRLQEANAKYDVLYKKMEVLYRILTKMYENSEIVLEDTKDQVHVKEQEFQAIRTSHGAIRSAMSILQGNPDQRAMFNQALEAMADEVSAKVGEMERFMDTSRHLMDTIDVQNGVFEEEGLQLLEQMENQSPLMADPHLGKRPAPGEKPLDLNEPRKEILKDDNDYHRLFE
jgi:predicted  nucleic acid-binding Zn-ribbon protein